MQISKFIFLMCTNLAFINIFCMEAQLKQLKINLNELNQKILVLPGRLQTLNQNINQNVLTEIITEEMLSGKGDMHDLEWLNLIGKVEKNKDKLIKLKFTIKSPLNLQDNQSTAFKRFEAILKIPKKLILDFSGSEKQITNLNLSGTNIDNFDFSKFTSLTAINLDDCPNLKGEANKDKIVDLSNSTKLDFEQLQLPKTTQARIVISNDTYLKWQSTHKGTQKWDITKLYQQQGPLAIFIVKNGDNFTLVYDKDLTQYKGWGEKEESEIKQYVIQELSKHK